MTSLGVRFRHGEPSRDGDRDNGVLVASQSSTAGTLAIPNDKIFRFPSDTLEAVALVGLLKADGMATIIPFWRNDAGNTGLQVATRALFSSVGTVKPGVQYEATQPDTAGAPRTKL